MKALSVSLLIISILCFLPAFFFRPMFFSFHTPWWLHAGVTIYLLYIFLNYLLSEGKRKGESINLKGQHMQVFPVILLVLSILSFLIAGLPRRVLFADLKWMYTGILFYLFFELRNFLSEAGKRTNLPIN